MEVTWRMWKCQPQKKWLFVKFCSWKIDDEVDGIGGIGVFTHTVFQTKPYVFGQVARIP